LSYNTKNYSDNGGDKTVIGGGLHIEDTAVLSKGNNSIGAFLNHFQVSATNAIPTSTTGIHAAVTDTGIQQVITTAINNPSVARNITATVGGTGANITAVQVIIVGTNYDGSSITETLPAFTAATPGTVQGLKAFKTITSITIPACGVGVTIAIGFGEVLGLPCKLAHNTVFGAYLNNVKEVTAPTVITNATTIENNTIKLNSALNSQIVDAYLFS